MTITQISNVFNNNPSLILSTFNLQKTNIKKRIINAIMSKNPKIFIRVNPMDTGSKKYHSNSWKLNPDYEWTLI